VGGRSPLSAMFVASACLAVPAAAPQDPVPAQPSSAAAPADARLDRYKKDIAVEVESRSQLAQQMVDEVFSFGELGFQEIETSKYLTSILEKNGFTVQRGLAPASRPRGWRVGDLASR
jgi:aminobenzoyl-glutamate utilization protein B